MKRFLISVLAGTAFLFAANAANPGIKPFQRPAGVFNSLDIAIQGGTAGIEFDLSTPVTKWGRLRAGYQYIPKYTIPVTFGMKADSEGNTSGEGFDKISALVDSLTGYKIDQNITMECTPNFYNFKLLADFYPLANKENWLRNVRVTAGFYYGSSRIGSTVNAMDEMPGLVLANLYNKLYDKVTAPDFVDWAIDNPINGDFGNPIYLDPMSAEALQKKFMDAGRIGMQCGIDAEGKPYMLEPGKDGTVGASVFVNRFKPYFGLGFDQPIAMDGRLSVGFDLGALFWGNPHVVTHDGTNLNSLSELPGQLQQAMDLMNNFRVYPVASFRIALTLF